MIYNKTKLLAAAFLACILSTSSFSLLANSPVKSIDKSGNVTYSDKPSADAVSIKKIPLHVGPSKSEIGAAQKQATKNIDAAEKLNLQKKNTSQKQNPSRAKPEITENVIYTGGVSLRPYASKLKPQAPIKRPEIYPPPQRPGINPPPTLRPVRRPSADRR